MKICVYHIRYKKDHGNIDTGYIGITNNPIRRQAEHWSALTLQSHKNYKLQKAFDDQPDDIDFIIYKEFSDRKSAELLEETLRPYKNVGWNIAVGGDRDFKERFQSKKFNITNKFIDQDRFESKFLLVNKNFTSLNLFCRTIFKPFINHWRKSNQAVILSNLFKTYYFTGADNLQPIELIQQAWNTKENVFQGDWRATPHDLTAVGFAIALQLQPITIGLADKLKYATMLGNIVEQIMVNGKLFQFNQIDALLIELIFEEYLVFNIEQNEALKRLGF
jgi:predicted GIY-YIG superfamily endonuclease